MLQLEPADIIDSETLLKVLSADDLVDAVGGIGKVPGFLRDADKSKMNKAQVIFIDLFNLSTHNLVNCRLIHRSVYLSV